MATPGRTRRPEGSTWGDFGPDALHGLRAVLDGRDAPPRRWIADGGVAAIAAEDYAAEACPVRPARP